MPSDDYVIGHEGLQFFGKISASISHELKNSLSIINECAGLLEDFASMSSKGAAVDPERLQMLGKKVRLQVRKTDTIIKRMNRFAHSADKAMDRVNLSNLLRQVQELSERSAALCDVAVDVEAPKEPILIMTFPFQLQNAIWICLEFALKYSGPEDGISLSASKSVNGAEIRLQPVSGLNRSVFEEFWPIGPRKAFLTKLGAEIILDELDQSLRMALPFDLQDRE